MRRTAAALIPLAVVLAGCGPARDTTPASGGSSAKDATIDVAEVTTRIVGASPEQEMTLREILAGLGRESRIASVRVNPHGVPPESDAVDVDLHLARGEAVRRDWEMWLVADAFAARSRELHLPRVAELFINGEDHASLDLGEVEPRDPVSADALSEQILAAAKNSGAKLARLELLRPNNVAVAVRLQVDDPARFLARRADDFLSGFPWPDSARYDGLLVEIVDADEALVWSHSIAASEDGGETTWGYLRPDLAGCDPLPSFGGPANKPLPPPCPAETPGSKTPLVIETVQSAPVTTSIIGATSKQRTILEQTLSRLGPTRLDSVEVHQKIDRSWGAPADAVGIDVKSSKPDGFTDSQAWTVANVFARRSLRLGLQPVGFVGVNGDRSGGHDWSADLSEVPITRPEADEALQRVAELAARHHASTHVRVFEPDRLAFAFYFVTTRPAEFLLKGLGPALRAIETANHDGLHVEVVEAGGERVLEAGWGVWVRPDLISCAHYGFYGSPSEPEPPPCPAK